jgi:hypothetical protein
MLYIHHSYHSLYKEALLLLILSYEEDLKEIAKWLWILECPDNQNVYETDPKSVLEDPNVESIIQKAVDSKLVNRRKNRIARTEDGRERSKNMERELIFKRQHQFLQRNLNPKKEIFS